MEFRWISYIAIEEQSHPKYTQIANIDPNKWATKKNLLLSIILVV